MWNFLSIVFSGYIIISFAAYLVNQSNIRKGLKGIPVKDCLNPLKWFNVLYGYFLKIIIPKHVFEQYVLRIYDEDCAICIQEGKCIGGSDCGTKCACGCDTMAKMYSPLEKDSGGNWDKIIFNKEEYEKHRTNVPVKIEIKYGN